MPLAVKIKKQLARRPAAQASLDITGVLCLLAVDARSLRSDITKVNPANKQVNTILSPKKGNIAIKENSFNRLNFCHE